MAFMLTNKNKEILRKLLIAAKVSNPDDIIMELMDAWNSPKQNRIRSITPELEPEIKAIQYAALIQEIPWFDIDKTIAGVFDDE